MIDISADFPVSKLNPLATPFHPVIVSLQDNQISFVQPQNEMASGSDFGTRCGDISVVLSMSNLPLDTTPEIINDALTPDISMRSDSSSKNDESFQIADVSRIPEASIMINGIQGLPNDLLLNPRAEPFFPKNRADLENITQYVNQPS